MLLALGAGIGLATAHAFAEAGAAVALVDINADALHSATNRLTSAGHKATEIRCNVADENEVAAMVQQTISRFGQLDIAFNNAGVHAPVAETADALADDFDRVIGINLRGIWNCMKHELRHMRARKRRDRQLLVAERGHRYGGSRRIHCFQAWRDRIDEERGS